MRTVAVIHFMLLATVWPALAQPQRNNTDDVTQGRSLAIQICAHCHVVARDQPNKPVFTQPTPSFAAIARRNTLDPDWLKDFLSTTHRGADNPKGMPSPELIDSHARQIIAYLMSLRSSAVSLPIWNVTPSCRGAADAGYVAQTTDQLQNCVNHEQRTREQLERVWATYPPLDRNQCIQSIKWFEPTYSELATCLEMRTQTRNAPQLEAPQRK